MAHPSKLAQPRLKVRRIHPVREMALTFPHYTTCHEASTDRTAGSYRDRDIVAHVEVATLRDGEGVLRRRGRLLERLKVRHDVGGAVNRRRVLCHEHDVGCEVLGIQLDVAGVEGG